MTTSETYADLGEAACSGAEHLATLGDTSDGGFVVPHVLPHQPDMDEVTFTWCHGPTGTSLLFTAHRNADPLLPPGVGWMQGTAGIAAYLLRLARVLREGRTTPAAARLDTWWNLP